MRLDRTLGRNRDIPLMSHALIPAAAKQIAADVETLQFTIPDLTKVPLTPSGAAGDIPNNSVTLRSVWAQPSAAALFGQATHWPEFRIQARRILGVNTTATTAVTSGSTVITPVSMNNIQFTAGPTATLAKGYFSFLLIDAGTANAEIVAVTAVTGTTFTASFANAHPTSPNTSYTIQNVDPLTLTSDGTAHIVTSTSLLHLLPVNTTSATNINATGNFTVTPVSMGNIAVGIVLYIGVGTGTEEVIVVNAVTATTFSAVFANTHSSTYQIWSAPIARLAFSSAAVNMPLFSPTLIPPYQGNTLLPGDIITWQRISNLPDSSSNIATPACYMTYEYVPGRR